VREKYFLTPRIKENFMKFGYTILYVSDVVETLQFYKKAFGFEEKFLHESNMYGELSTGETTLAFASNEMATLNGFSIRENLLSENPVGAEIAFVTNDVNSAYAKAIEAGATACTAPQEKPWGQIVSYVRDNNGFLVEICSPIN
jgi:lactoylglutathione lyase